MGVLLILAKTIAQALTTPELVTDSEEPLGTTVCMQYLLKTCGCYKLYYVYNVIYKIDGLS